MNRTSRGLRAYLLAPVALLIGLGLPFWESAGAWAADGVKAGQAFEVIYVVGDKEVFAEASLRADGSLLLIFPSADGKRIGRASYKLVRQDTTPDPGPDPKPKPDPTPDTKANFVYVIREGQLPKPDLNFAAIDNDKAWRDLADSLKVGWKVYDQNSTVFKTMPNPLTTARKVGLPAAVFVFPDGASKGEPLSGKKPADLAELIKKYGGAK